MSCIFWKYAGEDVIPKGKHLKQNLLNGVMKVVSREDFGESSTSQNMQLAPNFCENPCSSNLCKYLFYWWPLTLHTRVNLMRSTQILILSHWLLILQPYHSTIGFWYYDHTRALVCGLLHLSITPSCCILLNYILTFGRREMAIRLGMIKACGWQSLYSLKV